MTCTEVGVCSDGKRGHFGGGFLVFCNGFVSLSSTGWALPSLHSYRHPSCFSCTLNQKNIYIRRNKNPDIILKARDVIYDILLHYKLCCMANSWSVSVHGAGMCPVVTAFRWWRLWWLGVGLAWTGGVGHSSILYLVAPFPCMVFGLFIWCGSHFPGLSTNFISFLRCRRDISYLTESPGIWSEVGRGVRENV